MTDITNAPERIRVEQDAEGFWTCREAVSGSQEYVRADLYDKLDASRDAQMDYAIDLMRIIEDLVNSREIRTPQTAARFHYDMACKYRAAEVEPVWRDGVPSKPWSDEWFIAETTYGDRVVLTALPEEWAYDFKTADDTYIKADRIKRWMQFPDSYYLPPASPSIVAPVGVKTLPWREKLGFWEAQTDFIACYSIWNVDVDVWECSLLDGKFPTVEAAKAAAQTDYDRRVLSALAPALTSAERDRDHPDDRAVDRFAAAMKAKLSKKRNEGRGGWEDKGQCSNAFLSKLLLDHVEKGDPVDVGNLAMMIQQRGESICTTTERVAALSQLHAIVDAWEALPGGRQVRNRDVEAWLAEDMAPAINAIRGFLRRPRPDGTLPPPPALSTTKPAQGDGE